MQDELDVSSENDNPSTAVNALTLLLSLGIGLIFVLCVAVVALWLLGVILTIVSNF